MQVSPELWYKACLVYKKVQDNGQRIGRKKFAEALEISENLAQNLLFALQNRHLFVTSFQLPIERSSIELVISDLHVPYHDEAALQLVFDYLDVNKIKPNIITILGDFLDFYKISVFSKNPSKQSILEEIEEGKRILSILRNKFPDSRIIYLYGNHEDRLQRYIADNAPEIYDLLSDLLETKLELKSLNIDVQIRPFRIGRLWHLHGHERRGTYQPEYITNVIWKYVHDHYIVGHYHRSQEKVFKRIDGEVYWCGAVGHLAQAFDYAILNNWTQGFAIVEYDNEGKFRTTLKTICNGEIF